MHWTQDISSGVQRVLDARGQRGSWMPANKDFLLGYKKIFLHSCQKILTTFFYSFMVILPFVISKNSDNLF